MLNSRWVEIMVGLFVIAGIACLSFLVFSIRGQMIGKEFYNLNVDFSHAVGIEPGTFVRLAGVKVGEVKSIELITDPEKQRAKEKGVRIKIKLLKGLNIDKNDKISINTVGLFGERYIGVLFGSPSGKYYEPGDVIQGDDIVLGQDLYRKLDDLVGNVGSVINQIKSGQGTIGGLIYKDAIYNNLEAFSAEIKENPWKLLAKPSVPRRRRRRDTNKLGG